MKTTVLPPDHCPSCNYAVDRATVPGEGNTGPKLGDVTLCIRCGCWAAFGPGLRLRQLTDNERIDIAKNPEVQRVERAWRAVNPEIP